MDDFELPLADLPLDEVDAFDEGLCFFAPVVAVLLAAGFAEVSEVESCRAPAIANVAHTSRIATAADGRAIRIVRKNFKSQVAA